jgi:hypothetical protein
VILLAHHSGASISLIAPNSGNKFERWLSLDFLQVAKSVSAPRQQRAEKCAVAEYWPESAGD